MMMWVWNEMSLPRKTEIMKIRTNSIHNQEIIFIVLVCLGWNSSFDIFIVIFSALFWIYFNLGEPVLGHRKCLPKEERAIKRDPDTE